MSKSVWQVFEICRVFVCVPKRVQYLRRVLAETTGYRRGMIISDGEKDNVPEEKLKELQAELSKANGERVEKQSVYEVATSSPAESIPQVIDNERLSGYQVKLADLRRSLAELRSIYTPDHPRVKQVEAQIQQKMGGMLGGMGLPPGLF